jgi:hypothetical protein
MTEGLVERKKRLARAAAERTIERIETMRNTLNVHPWNATGEMDTEEALASFAVMVDDPAAWAELVDNEMRLWHLQPGRVPKRLFREAQDMYKRYLEAQPRGPHPVTEYDDAS